MEHDRRREEIVASLREDVVRLTGYIDNPECDVVIDIPDKNGGPLEAKKEFMKMRMIDELNIELNGVALDDHAHRSSIISRVDALWKTVHPLLYKEYNNERARVRQQHSNKLLI